MNYAKITGTGSYLPERILTNHDLAKIVNTTHEWIVERTGIHQRHIIGKDETTQSMGVAAAKKALEMAACDPASIELIIVATTSPEKTFPSAACQIQNMLGANGCAAFDVVAACAGFVHGLSIADQYIRSGAVKKALVIGAEALTRVTDWEDRTTCILFADGAGAVVLEASDEPGILSTHLHADGSYEELLNCGNAIGKTPEGDIDMPLPAIKMRGNEVFKIAVKTLSAIVDETLEKNNMQREDVDWLVPHQANMRIIQATAKKLGAPLEKVVVTVHKHGNTSTASIPIAFDEAVRDGRIQRGQNVLMETFGGGFAWGSALIKF